MGHGPSVLRQSKKGVFVDQELLEGSAKLRDDPIFRTSFTNFIKSGDWLDKLIKFPPQAQGKGANAFGTQGRAIYEYSMTGQLSCELKMRGANALIQEASSQWSLRSVTASRSQTISTRSDNVNDTFAESYFNIDGFSKFTCHQLMTIVFSVLFPIYINSSAYERFLKHGIERGRTSSAGDSSAVSDEMSMISERFDPTAPTKRAQAILLGCAAYFDEFLIDSHLLAPDWTATLLDGIEGYPFGITVVDTSSRGQVFVYANNTFIQQTGYQMSELSVSGMDILNGADTEPQQLALYNDAVSKGSAAKVGLTLYTKQRKPFVDLLAMRSVGCYSVAVHFVSNRATNVEDLKTVDDLLILLCHLVKLPADDDEVKDDASVRSFGWLPVPAIIMHNLRGSTRHRNSPRHGDGNSVRSFGSLASHVSHVSHASAGSAGSAGNGSAGGSMRLISIRSTPAFGNAAEDRFQNAGV